jgi:hypothetical protein
MSSELLLCAKRGKLEAVKRSVEGGAGQAGQPCFWQVKATILELLNTLLGAVRMSLTLTSTVRLHSTVRAFMGL